MMGQTLVEDLVDYVVTNGDPTAKGTDIFADQLPDTDLSPVTVWALKDIGGVPNFNNPIPTYHIQCICRSTSYNGARVGAANIFNLFGGHVGIMTTDYRIVGARAIQMPTSIGEDERGRNLVSFNMEFDVHVLGSDDGGDPPGSRDVIEIGFQR